MKKNHTKEELIEVAYQCRKKIIHLANKGGCFIGSAFSCLDIIVYLYECFLNIEKNKLQSFERDYFFLSKGHAVPALYAYFSYKEFIKFDLIEHYLQPNSYLYLHPNQNIPGIEFHSGSLGHLLSVSIGVAIDCEMKQSKNKVIVLLGDGELNEGSIWEALLIASAKKLKNLVIIIDRNKFQANFLTEKLLPLEPLKEKFLSFGLNVLEMDGHDFSCIEEIMEKTKNMNEKPTVIIANTIRGKGLPSIENDWDSWYMKISDETHNKFFMELTSKQ